MTSATLGDACLNQISQEYTYEELQEATSHFATPSLLGDGTYGAVYKGILQDGSEVAVKRLSRPMEAGFREEVEVLSRVRHPNLVILMGFARHESERYLVYELLPGGDMCARLQNDHNFVWRQRLSVALDAALGLSHLHASRPQVFHRDIKTQNILLDRNGTGKMADFGLALLAKPNCSSLVVEQAAGTAGYADPQYIRSGVVTERTEVYSYGMVLLEMLTRRPPAVQLPTGRIQYQFHHLKGELSRLLPLVDTRAHWPAELVEELASLAFACVHDEEALRPAFSKIVMSLRSLLQQPWVEEAKTFSPAPTEKGSAAPIPSANGAEAGADARSTRAVAETHSVVRRVPQTNLDEGSHGSSHVAPQVVLPAVQSLTSRTSEVAPLNWAAWTGGVSKSSERDYSPVATLDCGGDASSRTGAFLIPAATHEGAERMIGSSGDQVARFVGQARGSQTSQAPENQMVTRDHIEAMSRLQTVTEMGFSKLQAEEAFQALKRSHSGVPTVEEVVEWILSPDRQWNG